MDIEAADTRVATRVATNATRKIAGSKAEPDPVPLRNAEDMKPDCDENAFTDLVCCDNTEVDAMVWLTRAQFIANGAVRSCSCWRAGEPGE
jgi:hypothetical protein